MKRTKEIIRLAICTVAVVLTLSVVVMAKLLPENAATQDISVSVVSNPEMP